MDFHASDQSLINKGDAFFCVVGRLAPLLTAGYERLPTDDFCGDA